jgi:hypothetical protein
MDTADVMLADPEGVRIEHAFAERASEAAPAREDEKPGLSTDYLNHYSEILMLIEMASFDDAIVDEISGWQPIGYRAYFLKSPLRRAASAIAAYDRLADDQRVCFQQTIEALNKLTQAAILALQPPCHPQNVVLIGEVIGPAIRRQIDRAAAFLNSGEAAAQDNDDAQAIIDRLIG